MIPLSMLFKPCGQHTTIQQHLLGYEIMCGRTLLHTTIQMNQTKNTWIRQGTSFPTRKCSNNSLHLNLIHTDFLMLSCLQG